MPFKINPFSGDLDYYEEVGESTEVGPNTVSSASIINGSILEEDLNITTVERFDFNNVIRVNPSASGAVVGEVYLNLQDAVAYAQANATVSNTLLIVLTTSLTLNTKITLTNPYVGIKGLGTYNIVIQVDDSLAGDSVFELNYSSVVRAAPLGNFQLIGSSTLKNTVGTEAVSIIGQGIYYINTLVIQSFNTGILSDRLSGSVQVVLVEDSVTIRDCEKGSYVDNSSITFAKFIGVDNDISLDAQTNANIVVESGSFSGFQNTQTDTGLTTTGSPEIILNGIEFSNLAVGAELNGTGKVTVNTCNFETDTLKHVIVNGSIDLITIQTRLNTGKIDFNVPFNAFNGTYLDSKLGDKSFSVVDKMNVGLPNEPTELSVGGGNSYNLGGLFYSFDGTTFTDVKNDLLNIGDGTYQFPNTNTNTALYIGNIYGIITPGLKVTLTQLSIIGSGDIVFEYWNGNNYVEMNHMITESSDAYLPFANSVFDDLETRAYQIRFNNKVRLDWSKNDPMSLGTDFFWMRIRISSTITQSPEFDQIKLHTNYAQLNEDGFPTYSGSSRSLKKFPVAYGSFIPGANSPSNQDIYLSDRLFAGRNENSFQNNTTDRTGVGIALPFDIDTSCPINTHISYSGESGVPGTIVWELRWGWVKDNDTVYRTTGTAPTLGINERSVRVISNYDESIDTLKTDFVNLEIPEVISQRILNGSIAQGDLIFITVGRLANDPEDTYNSDINITELSFYYTSWRDGGHIKAEL